MIGKRRLQRASLLSPLELDTVLYTKIMSLFNLIAAVGTLAKVIEDGDLQKTIVHAIDAGEKKLDAFVEATETLSQKSQALGQQLDTRITSIGQGATKAHDAAQGILRPPTVD